MPLRMERASLEEDLAAYTFPVLDLPPEITAEIFVHFLPTYPECPLLNGFSISRAADTDITASPVYEMGPPLHLSGCTENGHSLAIRSITMNAPKFSKVPLPSVPPLMHLKSLILGLDSYDGRPGCVLVQKRVFDALTAPALTHLQISEHFFLYDPLPSITAFLSRSQCLLVSLHVTEARKSVDEYRTIFPLIDIMVDAED
ncbi:hypothetical protein C8J57DRAFT_1501196 [Mycena rebaudengoi]|nr:hypothetical protein C8J57DRAFT_1501196 [Mycena rebaudengoi]